MSNPTVSAARETAAKTRAGVADTLADVQRLYAARDNVQALLTVALRAHARAKGRHAQATAEYARINTRAILDAADARDFIAAAANDFHVLTTAHRVGGLTDTERDMWDAAIDNHAEMVLRESPADEYGDDPDDA